MDLIEGGIYRHYKGGLYRIISTDCRYEKTGETFVIYESLKDKQRWARPLDEFIGEVLHPEGVKVMRYVPQVVDKED